MENEVTVQDLISLSYEQKPIDFEQAFGALITDRLAQAVETKKVEVAQSMFGGRLGAEDEFEASSETDQEDLNTDDADESDETNLDTPEETEDGETA